MEVVTSPWLGEFLVFVRPICRTYHDHIGITNVTKRISYAQKVRSTSRFVVYIPAQLAMIGRTIALDRPIAKRVFAQKFRDSVPIFLWQNLRRKFQHRTL
jgi:hypothetical protein